MKFGKHIQSQQVPGWSSYYLDYKFLKKIISSLAANRPASEAAALASGVRPSDILGHTTGSSASAPSPRSPPTDPVEGLGRPPIITGFGEDTDRGPDYRAHKAAFFFKLERELEKINAFYLQKEAELKLRLETLLSKRRAAAMRGLSDNGIEGAQNHVEWRAVEEGFRLLERDLGKLQQFIEVNAVGFRKILKKFDKRAKATTKELYLSRQVDVQPVFNRQLISELSDTVAACLLDLTDLSSGLKFEGPAANDIFVQQIMAEALPPVGPFRDLENNLRKAIASREETAITQCIRYSDVLAEQAGSKPIVTRILWNALLEAPQDISDLILTSLPTPFDFQFVDDINERTCLHTASMAGSLRLVDLCIEKGVPVNKVDIYGRTALHYACMKGHPDISRRLLEAGSPSNHLDRDNYTPLIYATLRGSVDCVKILLAEGKVPAGPPQVLGDLSPLAVASQYGHVEVVVLLLEYGANSTANSNGEYPMHLAAREGRVDVCKVLITQEGWDTPDKYHEWTPLFHAARYGQAECLRVLLDAGAKLDGADELGHLAVYYTAWYGHQSCLKMMLEAAAARSQSAPHTPTYPQDSPMKISEPDQLDIDLIPSLALPPPIMPHRVYGHNYLDRNNLVQVTINHTAERPGVRLHHRHISPTLEDEYIVASTPLKLVMTTSQGVNSAPYTVTLPQRSAEAFSFQVPSLQDLSLEFSVYPNFGTKTIGRAVALPSMFIATQNVHVFTLPILDTRLHVIGEVDVELRIVTSFEGVTLEVGGDVETYWKSLTTTPSVAQLGVPQWPHRSSLIGSAQASPSVHSVTNAEGQVLTISSVQGSYLGVVVQVTRDFHPVVYSDWLLPASDLDIGVSDVTLDQFEALGRRLRRDALPVGEKSLDEWSKYLSSSMISLAQLLQSLPLSINLSIELAYPSSQTRNLLSIRHRIDLNVFADSVLRHIYHGSTSPGSLYSRRQIIFSSYSPDVCAVLNWKQPNYPVFFASRCGKASTHSPSATSLGVEEAKDPRLSSIGAAVEFAKSNNLLGVFVDAELLVQVPSLINGIRNAGLLVGVHGEPNMLGKLVTDSDIDGTPVDAYMEGSHVLFTDHSIQELL